MKKLLLTTFVLLSGLLHQQLLAQCTPVNCASRLPAYGGLCDTVIAEGLVNTAYASQLSIVLGGVCFNVQQLDPSLPNVNARITNVKNITFQNVPAGLTAATNQTTYSPPNGGNIAGCVGISGTPTQAGVFSIKIGIVVDVVLCGLPIPQNNNAVSFPFKFVALPDASFSGLNASYCLGDGVVSLTPTGTTGGVFSGPGVVGNTFNPNLAGPGDHTITYTVSAQQGSAIAPATNSSSISVKVNAAGAVYFADKDNDGFGDAADSVEICAGSPPTGYVKDNTDCNDADSTINPSSVWFEDKDADGYSTGNTLTQCEQPLGYVLQAGLVSAAIDCNDDSATLNLPLFWFEDKDGDLYSTGTVLSACERPEGYVLQSELITEVVDCDDKNAAINPETVWYLDADADGWASTTNVVACVKPDTTYYLSTELEGDSIDCNDADNSIYPGATEIADDGIDQDCDGSDLITLSIKGKSDIEANLYPNPSTGQFNLVLQPKMSGNYSIQVLDISGRVFQSKLVALSAGNQVIPMNIGNSGVYLVNINFENQQTVLKVIIE
jgi:hypothetical protein